MKHPMKCPACGSANQGVKDSRQTEVSVRRRRWCFDCGHRFTTQEQIVPDRESLKTLREIAQGLEAAQTILGNLQASIGKKNAA